MNEPTEKWKLSVFMGREVRTETVEIPKQDLEGTEEENLNYVMEAYCDSQFISNFVQCSAEKVE